MKDIEKETYKIISEVSENYEKELIKKIKEEKDKDAFFKLVKIYDRRIYSLVYRFLGNKEDAMELTQDIFVQAYKKLHQYRGDSPFIFWLQRIAINFCLNKIKMDKKDLLKKAESLDGKPNFLYSTYKNPSDIVEEKEKNNFVRQCLQKVSPTFRMVVILKDIEGLSYEEISKLLKCSLGTVKSRLSRGREELKKILFKLKDEVNEYEM